MRTLIGLFIFIFSLSALGANLLKQPPRAYSTYPGFNKRPSTCKNLISTTRQHLNLLKKKGHRVALIFNNGSGLPLPKLRIKDQFKGVTYNNINDLVAALEDHARRNSSWSSPKDYQELVRKCLRGRIRMRSEKKVFPTPCTQPLRLRHLHSGFAILNPGTNKDPYIIHLYGDEKYNYLKASLRVETLDSYLEETKMHVCESKVATLTGNTQSRIINFFKGGHASRLLAKGNKNFNLISNPWATESQNCNAWTSEALATMLFGKTSRWSSANREQAKQILWRTGFRPYKIPLKTTHALARLPALFINGIDMEEGNVNHTYSVADIIPTESIQDWLLLHGKITSMQTVRGRQ